MKNIKLKFNKNISSGFTLIETMIAIFILVLAMNGLFGLISSSLFAARYAKNDIIANYLIQEALDYVRNDRDTIAFLKQAEPSGGWDNFLLKYGYSPSSQTLCFGASGCEIEPTNILSNNINICATSHNLNFGTIDCKLFNYDENASNKNFYTYSSSGIKSNFKRKVLMSINNNNTDELDVKVTIEWQNGNLLKSRSSTMSLLNWQK